MRADLSQTEPELLRGEDVQRILSISKTTYWELIWSGQLRSVRIGRAVRIPREALDDYKRSLPSASQRLDGTR